MALRKIEFSNKLGLSHFSKEYPHLLQDSPELTTAITELIYLECLKKWLKIYCTPYLVISWSFSTIKIHINMSANKFQKKISCLSQIPRCISKSRNLKNDMGLYTYMTSNLFQNYYRCLVIVYCTYLLLPVFSSFLLVLSINTPMTVIKKT